MRTPREVYDVSRRVYHPELESCPVCGGKLKLCNYLTWEKTIQTFGGSERIGSRPSQCREESCPSGKKPWGKPWVSAEALQRSPRRSTYGYEVIAQIGWERQERRDTFREIGERLNEWITISESEVRFLYQQVYLPLLACEERQNVHRLEEVIARQGGLIVALDGLCPEGGEPQLWFMRELTSGLTLRSGWMSRQDEEAFRSFLTPLAKRGWPLLAVLSDKQRGLVPAVAAMFPGVPHPFCQAHYLRNLAEPLAAADQTFKVALRKAVREEVGEEIRQETGSKGTPGVLTVTGVLPDEPPDERREVPPNGEAPREEPSEKEACPAQSIDDIVIPLLRRIRYLLTLEGRPPFRLAGVEMYARLKEMVDYLKVLLAHRSEPRLVAVVKGLEAVLPDFALSADDLAQGARWLTDIAALLDPTIDGSGPRDGSGPGDGSGDPVAHRLNRYLDQLLDLPLDRDLSPVMAEFQHHLRKVTDSYAPGLFHCYSIPGVPRTNNGLESHFRDTTRRLLRTTGQKGQCLRTLQRTGAWELLRRFPSPQAALQALQRTAAADFKEEQERFRRHQDRFKLHTRSPRVASRQLQRLLDDWINFHPPDTG